MILDELDIHQKPVDQRKTGILVSSSSPKEVTITGLREHSRKDIFKIYGGGSLVSPATHSTKREHYIVTAEPPVIHWTAPKNENSLSVIVEDGQTVTLIRKDLLKAGCEWQVAGFRVCRPKSVQTNQQVSLPISDRTQGG